MDARLYTKRRNRSAIRAHEETKKGTARLNEGIFSEYSDRRLGRFQSIPSIILLANFVVIEAFFAPPMLDQIRKLFIRFRYFVRVLQRRQFRVPNVYGNPARFEEQTYFLTTFAPVAKMECGAGFFGRFVLHGIEQRGVLVCTMDSSLYTGRRNMWAIHAHEETKKGTARLNEGIFSEYSDRRLGRFQLMTCTDL